MKAISCTRKRSKGELNRKQMRNEGMAEHMKDNGREKGT